MGARQESGFREILDLVVAVAVYKPVRHFVAQTNITFEVSLYLF